MRKQNNPLRWSRAGAVTGTTIKERGREKLYSMRGEGQKPYEVIPIPANSVGGPLFLIVVNARADALLQVTHERPSRS